MNAPLEQELPAVPSARHVALSSWAWPVLAFALSRFVFSCAALARRVGPLSASTWSRWDSGHYLAIATRGYTIYPCAADSGYPAGTVCGNAAWFPGYSLLVRAAAGLTRLPLETSAMWLSAAFALAVLVLVQAFAAPKAAPWLVLLAAFFPGAIYLHAIFPISMFLAFALLFLHFLGRGRPALAFACGAVCGVAYSTGFLLALVPPGVALLRWRLTRQAWKSLWPSFGPAAGMCAVFALQAHQTRIWNAYGLVQAHYQYAVPALVDTLFSHLKPLVNAKYRSPLALTTATQTLLVLLVMATALSRWWQRRREPGGNGVFEDAVAVYCVLYWSLPLVMGGRVSLHRAEALLVPVLFLWQPRARWAAGALAAFALVAAPLAWHFFGGTLT